MDFSGIYGITDDALLPPQRLAPAVAAALGAGIAMLQYRSKSGSQAERLARARELQSLCQPHRVPLIINDDVELCLQAGAAGVHLGDDDASLAQARQLLGPDAIIGITCHDSLERAVAAQQGGADYVAFGRFYPSRSKPQASPAGTDVLTRASSTLDIPLVAIGGINADNGAALLAAGADMLAVIHSLFGSEDVAGNAAALVKLFQGQHHARKDPTS